MSSQIPPLVCHTPPPIDFDADDDDDDYGSDIPDDDVIGIDDRNGTGCPEDDFGDFATVLPGAKNLDTIPTEAVIDKETEDLTSIPTVAEAKDNFPARLGSDSPPSLILPPNDYTEAGDGEPAGDGEQDDDEEGMSFQPFGNPVQPPDPPPEDSISLPSLHFDADVSKSDEEDHVPVQLNAPSSTSGSAIETEVDLPVAAAAERTTPVIQECGRFDDNTENDFTDFTTASNERSSVVLEVPTANDVSFELDDFAQLESTPSADSNFVSQQSRTDFATFDADFSKFDSFQASFPATVDDAVPVKTPVEETRSMPIIEQEYVKKNSESIHPEDDFDDFQEFATFSEQPAVPTISSRQAGGNEETESMVHLSFRSNIGTEMNSTETRAEESVAQITEAEQNADDEDDFGDFNDFKQSEAISTHSVAPPVTTFSMENVQLLLEAMFPNIAPQTLATDTGQQMAVNNIPHNTLHSQLQDFDNTNALSYQYSKSSSSKTLVTALGIDSRNIMYGPKWNSSMPRFAANLSFNPLEPLKPISASMSKDTGSGANEKNVNIPTASKVPGTIAAGLDPLQAATVGANTSVPAVQFDWNSSGLVNPLEGVQEMLQKATAGQSEDGPKSEVLDSQVTENASPTVADDIAVVASSFVPKPAVSTHPAEDEDVGSLDFTAGSSSSSSNVQYSAALQPAPHEQQFQQQQVEPPPSHHYVSTHQQPQQQQQPQSMSISSSPNSVPVVRTIKLPETHIFTPSRGVTPISRDITDRDIVVREYHDVEYSLEKSAASVVAAKKELDVEDFNDFQSVPASGPSALPTSASVASIVSSRPVIGRSPTEELERAGLEPDIAHSNNGAAVMGSNFDVPEDDEFSDFQTAIPPPIPVVPPINRAVTNVQNNRSNTSSPVMLLSPAILLPQQTNTSIVKESANMRKTASAGSINWPDPGIDPDELARFEAAFAKPAVSAAAVPSLPAAPNLAASQHTASSAPNKAAAVEEDEWTDFISSKPVADNEGTTVQPAPSASMGGQEEWTDFISNSATVTAGGFTSHNRLSSSQNSFNYPRAASKASHSSISSSTTTSWTANQPAQLPPPQFSSWNSNSLYYNPMSALPLANQQQSSQYLPHQQQQQNFYHRHSDIPAMAFAGGAGFSGTPKVPTNPPHHHAPMGQQQPPMQLLPELSFITPNVTTGHSAGTAGAKPTTHSFLSNVISSNNFTKK
uniref:Clathrin_bdg domain-containing protein n=1 Tax=Anopheles dirus TaxID=7168 RepID=A0A182NG73_9DIPT